MKTVLILFFVATPAVAQNADEEEFDLGTIEVEAEQGRALEPTPAPGEPADVAVVDAREVERTVARNAADALQLVPGLQLEGPHNQRDRLQRVRIRGFEPEHTLVLVDGERVTSRSGHGDFDLSSVPAGVLDRIEVVRGPLAVLRGADAIGGVVDLITDRPIESFAARALAGYGSFETATGQVVLELPVTAALGLRLDATRDVSRGWSDAWELDRQLRRISAREDARSTERSDLGLTLSWTPSADHLVLLRQRLHLDRRFKRKLSDRYTERGTELGIESGLNLDSTLAYRVRLDPSVSLRSSVHLYRHQTRRLETRELLLRAAGRDTGSLDGRDADDVEDWLASATTTLELRAGEHRLRVLAQGRWQWRASDNHALEVRRDVGGRVVTHADFRRPERIYGLDEGVIALAIEDRWRLERHVLVTVGARGEHHSICGPFAVPAAGLSWRPLTWIEARAAAGIGYRTPPFDRRARPAVPVLDPTGERYRQGNRDLRPEISFAQEIGLSLAYPALARPTDEPRDEPRDTTRERDGAADAAPWRLALDVTGFHNRFVDKIQTIVEEDYLGSGLPLERDINLAQAWTAGVELAGSLELVERLRVRVAYTGLATRDEQRGAPFDRASPHILQTQITASWPDAGFQATAGLRWVAASGRYDEQGNLRADAVEPDQWLCDLRVSQRLIAGLELLLDLTNLLDWHWDRDGDGDSDLAPRAFFLALRGRT